MSICIRTLSVLRSISIFAKILFSGSFSSFTMCTRPSVESKVKDGGGRIRIDHVNIVTWSAVSTGSTLENFGEIVWFVASAVHRTKRSAFEALLDVTSSAVFTTLQQIFLGSGIGCFGPLLRRFSDAFHFLRLSNAFTVSSGLSVLVDCPLIALKFPYRQN